MTAEISVRASCARAFVGVVTTTVTRTLAASTVTRTALGSTPEVAANLAWMEVMRAESNADMSPEATNEERAVYEVVVKVHGADVL